MFPTVATLRRIPGPVRGFGLLAYPPPFRCWLTVSNDPDGTSPAAWDELHEFIWRQLGLPLADSFFLVSHNETVPGQVNVREHGHILKAHPHDTMHAWGDYCGSRTRRFSRDDAIEGLDVLKAKGVIPRIWVDHANFSGNLLHRATVKPQRFVTDASGNRHENLEYTLDLIHAAGVRYLWDGSLTPIVGQDRPVGRREWYAIRRHRRWKPAALAAMDALFAPVWRKVKSELFSYYRARNEQYARCDFAEGFSFYTFTRYGRWELADVDGLAALVGSKTLDRLAAVQGTAVAYTHLGKRRAAREHDPRHIPPQTADALETLAQRYRSGQVMVSSTSDLLDYLVLRDHARVTLESIDFVADGVRYDRLGTEDLAGHRFGVFAPHGDFQVLCEGEAAPACVERVDTGVFLVTFPPTEGSSPVAHE